MIDQHHGCRHRLPLDAHFKSLEEVVKRDDAPEGCVLGHMLIQGTNNAEEQDDTAEDYEEEDEEEEERVRYATAAAATAAAAAGSGHRCCRLHRRTYLHLHRVHRRTMHRTRSKRWAVSGTLSSPSDVMTR